MKTRFTSLLAGACAVLAMTTCLPTALAVSDSEIAGSNDISHQSWVADGWKATITHADGTVEQVPNLSDLSTTPVASKPTTNPRELAEAIPGRQWLREIREAAVAYYGPEDAGHPQYDQPSTFRPTWLPEGWGLEEIDQWDLTDQISYWTFRKETSQMKMTCYRRSTGYIGMALYDQNASFESRKESSAVEFQQVQVQGRSADFYQAGSTAYLIWENEGGDLFILEGDLDRTAMVQVADSVKEVKDQTLPEYKLGWEPEGPKAVQSYSLPGAVITRAVPEGASLIGVSYYSLLYASEPVSTPVGTPEAVKVKGAEAQYWKGTLVADPFSNEALFAKEEQMSVLVWTDLKTNLTFRIQGVLDKDTMIRMAESIVLK